LVVSLYRDGRQITKALHRLIAEAFLVEDPERRHVNHINGNRRDNRAANLEWCTVSENVAHAARTGLMSSGLRNGAYTKPERVRRGALNGRAKLTDEQVREIRLATGKHRDIAFWYGVSHPVVGGIKRGQKWRHVQ